MCSKFQTRGTAALPNKIHVHVIIHVIITCTCNNACSITYNNTCIITCTCILHVHVHVIVRCSCHSPCVALT